jgi:hypothetical protein
MTKAKDCTSQPPRARIGVGRVKRGFEGKLKIFRTPTPNSTHHKARALEEWQNWCSHR